MVRLPFLLCFSSNTDLVPLIQVGANTGAISQVGIPFGGIKESGFGREGTSRSLPFSHLTVLTLVPRAQARSTVSRTGRTSSSSPSEAFERGTSPCSVFKFFVCKQFHKNGFLVPSREPLVSRSMRPEILSVVIVRKEGERKFTRFSFLAAPPPHSLCNTRIVLSFPSCCGSRERASVCRRRGEEGGRKEGKHIVLATADYNALEPVPPSLLWW